MMCDKQLKPGDLVVFNNRHTYGSKTRESYASYGSWMATVDGTVMVALSAVSSQDSLLKQLACVLHPTLGTVWVSVIDLNLIE